ncbi:MAG: hypothetical protein PVF51_11365 [Nitrospirota bacterium]
MQRLLEKHGFRVYPTPFQDWEFWGALTESAPLLGNEFSPWVRFGEPNVLDEYLAFVGVYQLAKAKRTPTGYVPPPKSVLYVGEISRTLGECLQEFANSTINGRRSHGGGRAYYERYGSDTSDLFVSVLRVRSPALLRGDAVSLLERFLIWLYATRWGSSPKCDSK